MELDVKFLVTEVHSEKRLWSSPTRQAVGAFRFRRKRPRLLHHSSQVVCKLIFCTVSHRICLRVILLFLNSSYQT